MEACRAFSICVHARNDYSGNRDFFGVSFLISRRRSFPLLRGRQFRVDVVLSYIYDFLSPYVYVTRPANIIIMPRNRRATAQSTSLYILIYIGRRRGKKKKSREVVIPYIHIYLRAISMRPRYSVFCDIQFKRWASKGREIITRSLI